MGKDVDSNGRNVNILHVFPSFGLGGQQSRFANLAKLLGPQFQHHVLALDGDLSARSLVPENCRVAYQIFDIKKSSLASMTNVKNFRRICGEISPDLLCTYNWGSIEAVLANRFGVQERQTSIMRTALGRGRAQRNSH